MIIRVILYFVLLGAYIILAISNVREIITIKKLSTRIDHMREKMEELKNEELKKQSINPSGKWDMFDEEANAYCCSICKTVFCLENGTPKDNEYNYCPNCGAKMESEDNKMEEAADGKRDNM